jgi:hypothetical protein
VIQGNDSRLRTATTEYPGISQLAQDGETRPGVVIQGNDSRLRTATTEYPGISQLALHNESEPLKVLQSDDPRLLEGTEFKKGRVQFSKNGEIKSGKAVQSDDDRLQPASNTKYGIVKLAEHGKFISDSVVQSNDPRLCDKREPKDHTHPYAQIEHSFNSHFGPLNISLNLKNNLNNDTQTYLSSTIDFPLSIINREGFAAGFDGGVVMVAEKNSALNAFSNENTAIQSISRKRSAAVFLSEQDYALKLPLNNNNIKGSGKAIFAEGLIKIKGELNIHGSRSIAIYWDKNSSEAFSEGDVLTISNEGVLGKINNSNQKTIGVFANKSNIILGESKQESVLIVILGIVNVKVKGKVEAGNLLGYSKSNNLGVVSKVLDHTLTIISLESSMDENEKLISCLIR